MREVEASKKPDEIGALVRREGVYFALLTGWRRELRAQLSHPNDARPELLASVPSQVWSWDISKLKRPAQRSCYEFYVILDVHSRYVVGYRLAERESAELATKLIERPIAQQRIDRDQLTIHTPSAARR